MSDRDRRPVPDRGVKLRPPPPDPPLYMPAMPPLGLLTAIGNGVRILVHRLRRAGAGGGRKQALKSGAAAGADVPPPRRKD